MIKLELEYAYSLDEIKNYGEIVSRMQRVNQNLREEFQIISMAELEAKRLLGLKID